MYYLQYEQPSFNANVKNDVTEQFYTTFLHSVTKTPRNILPNFLTLLCCIDLNTNINSRSTVLSLTNSISQLLHSATSEIAYQTNRAS